MNLRQNEATLTTFCFVAWSERYLLVIVVVLCSAMRVGDRLFHIRFVRVHEGHAEVLSILQWALACWHLERSGNRPPLPHDRWEAMLQRQGAPRNIVTL